MVINEELKMYIEENVFPVYHKNELGHAIGHIKKVIDKSFKIVEENELKVNINIVYTVAAYHDIGHYINPKEHEKVSARIMKEDQELKKFFSQDELLIIEEAIEDHRASSKYESRSVYGKIVSSADRNDTVLDCLLRSYFYYKNLNPKYTEEQVFENAYQHLIKKFGHNGYAKMYFIDTGYKEFLKELRSLLDNKEEFIKQQRLAVNNRLNNGGVL